MRRATITVKEIAIIEGVSERSAQRYCTVGFDGHVLSSLKIGRSRRIFLDDYREWRRVCGFPETPDSVPVEQPRAVAQPSTPAAPDAPAVDSAEVLARAAQYPPWPFPADPNGVITNVPHEHSCNHPHPLAVKAHNEEAARALLSYYGGEENAESQD